jgi:hypothetical protein
MNHCRMEVAIWSVLGLVTLGVNTLRLASELTASGGKRGSAEDGGEEETLHRDDDAAGIVCKQNVPRRSTELVLR